MIVTIAQLLVPRSAPPFKLNSKQEESQSKKRTSERPNEIQCRFFSSIIITDATSGASSFIFISFG
jgi:hypothetical protein